MKTVLITGCSSGFGKLTAEYLKDRGYKVIATTRKELDVTWPLDKITKYINKLGRIDVLVNNAGYGQFGGIYELNEKQIRDQYETNVFGLLKVTKSVLPIMRKVKSGLIINVSSISGFITNINGGIYASSKHAVESVTQALRYEESKFGIKVTSVNPGPFATNFWRNNPMTNLENPIVFAKKIESIIESKNIYPRYMVGLKAELIRIMYRIFPDWALDVIMSNIKPIPNR